MEMATVAMPLWLDQPVPLTGSREYECSLNETSQCDYQTGYWRFWYELDHRYGQPTMYLCLAVIAVFTLSHVMHSTNLIKTFAKNPFIPITRWLSYRTVRVSALRLRTPPVGVSLLGLLGFVFFTCMALGPKPYYWPNTATVKYGDSPPLAARSGWMATALLPFVFATSAKANMITALTGISHERLHVFHRWTSFAMLILSLLHTFPFIVVHIQRGDMMLQVVSSIFYWSGITALLAQLWLTFASLTPLRRWNYEFFKISHFVAAFVFTFILFLHCDATLTSWHYFIGVAAVYLPCLIYPWIRTYLQYGVRTATLTKTSNGFIRVSVVAPAHWRPGQHFFIRFLSLGLHSATAHPFTACSLPSENDKESVLEFYIRAQGGITSRLYSLVGHQPSRTIKVLLDGPYGGIDSVSLAAEGDHLVIAGGSGAGWTLPLVERHLQRILAGRLRTDTPSIEKQETQIPSYSSRSLRVILATRESETSQWFQQCVNDMLARYSTHSDYDLTKDVRIDVFNTCNSVERGLVTDATEHHKDQQDDIESGVSTPNMISTKANNPHHTTSLNSDALSASNVNMTVHQSGRPDLAAIIAQLASESTQVSVFSCGPRSMQEDVGQACARQQLEIMKRKKGSLYLHLEHFDWA